MKDKKVYSKVRKIFLIFLIMLLVFLAIQRFGTCIIEFLLGKYIDTKIEGIVQEKLCNLTNEAEKIQALSNWFKSNIDYVQLNDEFFNLLRNSWCRVPPEIAFVMKKGRCGEWASLYLKLLNYANITGRIVNFVEDHAIVEVLINNAWIPVEPSGGISSYDYYKTSRNISKAYAIEENGRIKDVTVNYADTGFLTIKVRKENILIQNAKVCVLSKYLMLADPQQYKEPTLAFCNFTNEFGIHTEQIGKGIYKIEVLRFTSPFECQTALMDNYTLLPNSINEVTLEIKEENFLSCFTKFIVEQLNKPIS